jgi:hypothetical protein
MKGTPYPEEWVEGYNHWFSGPPHLRLDGLAGFVRILVSRRGSRHSRFRGKRSAQSLGSRFCPNVLNCRGQDLSAVLSDEPNG